MRERTDVTDRSERFLRVSKEQQTGIELRPYCTVGTGCEGQTRPPSVCFRLLSTPYYFITGYINCMCMRCGIRGKLDVSEQFETPKYNRGGRERGVR